MIRQFPSGDHYLPLNLDDVLARAVEGDAQHAAIEVAQADVAVTLANANTAVDVAVTFSRPFVAAPVVAAWLVGAGNVATYINLVSASVTTTGFTLRAASGAAQTLNVRWLAYGRRQ